MRYIAFLILVIGSMWLWNKSAADTALNAPANAASSPVAHEPTITESVSQWFVDHTPKK